MVLIETSKTVCPRLDKGVVGKLTKVEGGIWLILLTVARDHADRRTRITRMIRATMLLTLGRLLLGSASLLLAIAVHIGGFQNRSAIAPIRVKVFPALRRHGENGRSLC